MATLIASMLHEFLVLNENVGFLQRTLINHLTLGDLIVFCWRDWSIIGGKGWLVRGFGSAF